MKSATLNGVELNSMEYDDYGRQSKLTEKNSGITLYDYNAYGELASQTNSTGHQYNITYDVLGRVVQKTGTEGTYSYVYVQNGNGLNRPETVTGPNGIFYSYEYYPLGRLKKALENIEGQSFIKLFEYNRFGNLTKQTYPGGFAIERNYNQQGYHTQTKISGSNALIWQLDEVNVMGQATKYTLGNGIQSQMKYSNFGLPELFDAGNIRELAFSFNHANNNLQNRNSIIDGIAESFSYDALDRLTTSQVTNIAPQSVIYNANGNISSKSSIGNYTYHAVKINAVTQVENTDNLISSTEQFIGYNAFNKVASVSEGDHTYFITYGPDETRKKSVMNFQNTTVYTRYYLGDYEKTVAGSNTTEVHYLDGGAMYVVENGAGSLYYTYKDHLGSLLEVTDNTGNIIAKQNFDAWGNKRNPFTWDYASIPATPAWLYRGFTGHEHLPEFGLINMNGRMYDPLLGRMLSPDNFVQAPDYSQSFNRYSYCINNPLKFTDPTGGFFWSVTTGIVDFISTALFKGGLDLTSKNARQNAWRDFDPTSSWSKTNKTWKIDMGLFKSDPNKNLGGQIWELISRFSYQAPQTSLGYTGTGIHNLLGGVRSVDYYGGATVVESNSRNWGAITLGSYINGSRGITADPNDILFQHEYGHYLQSQASGWLYLSKYGIPSVLSKSGTSHSLHPVEQDANIRAFKYFNKHIDGYAGWNFDPTWGNPINGYDPSLPYNNVANQTALTVGKLRIEWFDYLLVPGIIIPGLVNSIVLNNRY